MDLYVSVLAYFARRWIKVPVQILTWNYRTHNKCSRLQKNFQLPQATDNNHVGFVDAPTFGQMAQFFRHNLGFKLPLQSSSNFVSKGLPQPWQTLCKIFARCLTTRATGHDQPPVQIIHKLYCFINNVHVDYAKILWEGLHFSLTHPANLIPYLRFTKFIIDYYMTEHPDTLRRVHDNYHRVKHDDLIKNIFNSRKNKDRTGMKILDWMLTDEIKHTNHYRMYTAIFQVDVPMTQSQPIERQEPEPKTPIPTTAEIDVTNLHETIQISIATQRSLEDFKAKQNVEKVQEHIVDKEIENLLEGNDNVNVDEFMNNILNNQEDPGTRIEPRNHKESMEAELDADLVHVNSNEEEEESAEETLIGRRREKVNGIEETRNSPSSTPIRSPRNHNAPLSTDKEKLQELTVTDLTSSSFTPSSSSSPKPKTGCFKRCKSFIHHMGGCYGLLFGHLVKSFMLQKNFNKLSEMLYQALKEMIPSMVNKEVKKIAKRTVPVYVVEGLLLERQKYKDDVVAMIVVAIRKERQTLHAEVIYQVNDVVANHIPSQFEGITFATACRPSAIRTRDHDDYQDDDARPEGESSAKRYKTFEYGTYSVGTQEQLDEFYAWMEDAGTDDDDEVPDDKISQELVDEMSEEIDEDEIQNYLKNDIVWESRKERLTLPTLKKKAPVFFSCQRDPKAPPLTLMNQDLFYLKHENLGPKKYTLSLHKFHVVLFPDDDMEE
ncbi:hypothetical protein Tco_0745543 [Tanacetum coccineum]